MKLSIITVTYNAEKALKQTLESIEKQKNAEIELLIIDGCSTDKTIEIAHLYRNKIDNMKVFSELDKGIYDAMNKGINLSSGDYLFFLNAGDVFFDNSVLDRVLSQLNGKDVYYGDSYISNQGSVITPYRVGRFSKYRLAVTNICHQSIFYPRYLISANKYNIKYRIVADWVMNMSIWKERPFMYIKTPVVLYEGGGLSSYQLDNEFKKDYKKLVIRNLGIFAFIYLCVYKMYNYLFQ